MNVKIVFAITGFALLVVSKIFAQSYSEEALLISRIRAGGTARMQGMGGVQNSLGGDISSTYYNPAGLGMYNRSDFSISPGYINNSAASSFLGNTGNESKSNIIVPNLGIAFTTKKDGTKGLLNGTLGLSYNRVNDFNSTFSYQGTNPDNSIIDYFVNDANGTGTSQFTSSGYNYNTPTGLAYFNYLIGPQSILSPNDSRNINRPNPGPNNQYFTDVSGIPLQSEVVKTSGAQSQFNISYGVNFSDKFFVGGGLGLASLNYKSVKTYTESFTDSNQPMSSLKLEETLNLSGSGFNLTLGTIIRPVDQVQVGFSLATPTSYSITDNYSAAMSTKWNNFEYLPGKFINSENAKTDIVTSNYNLATPWRFSGGATFFIGKHGFVSADAEYLKYSSAKYSSNTGDDYSADNKEIKGLYKSVINLRFGGEYRLNNYRFRGGYSLMPDPFQTQQNGVDRSFSSYSAGFGYRVPTFYIDFAVVLGQSSNSYRPYRLPTATSPLVTLDNKSTSFLFTIGFPF